MGKLTDLIKKNKIDVSICLVTGMCCVIVFYVIFHVWNFDLNVPFAYSGDVIGMLQKLNVFARGESLANIQSLGAPYGSNQWHQMMDALLPQGIMYCLARITQSVGYTINAYFILTFAFSSMCTFAAMRMLKISRVTAIACGIIYAFIPGHMLRSQSHIFIGSCFSIPLMAVAVIYLMRGELCRAEYRDIKKLTFKEAIHSTDKKIIFCIISLAATTVSSLYYGVFGMFILIFAAVYISLNKRQWRHFVYFMWLCITELVCIVVIYLPPIISKLTDPFYNPINIVSRQICDVENYGLKFIQLILPVSDHRFSIFAKITERYNNSGFPLVNENRMSTLGLVMAAGFLFSFLIVLFKICVLNDIQLCAHLNVYMFCVGVIGGGASIIGFINYGIRCYNRFSFYIGIFSLIVVAKIFDAFWNSLKNKNVRQNLILKLKIVSALLIACVALLDQTTENMAFSAEKGAAAAGQFYNDKDFVQSIEGYEGKNASVLVLPFSTGNQGALGYTKENVFTVYQERIMTMHSETSKWSVGAASGERAESFLDNLSFHKDLDVLKIASVVGYNGIAIYRLGFEETRLSKWVEVLEDSLGKPAVESGDGKWVYYSISDFANDLRQHFSNDEWAKLQKMCFENIVSRKILGKELSNTSDQVKYENDAMIISQGEIQYGPYYNLLKGDYKIIISGDNLDEGEFRCTSEQGQIEIQKLDFEKSEHQVSYDIHLEENTNYVEFLCENKLQTEIKIDTVECTQAKDEDEKTLYNRLLEIKVE